MARTPVAKAQKRTCAVMPHHYFLVETDPVYRDNRRIIGRKLEHGYCRRIHQADRDPAGLLRQHQGDHDGTNHGSGSPERAAVILPRWFNPADLGQLP